MAVGYDGLKGCTDYRKAAQIIKDGGYATNLTYVDKLCSIIEKWNLTRFDAAPAEDEPAAFKPYLVRVSITNLNIRKGPGTNYARRGYTGKGLFTIVEEADGKGASRWGKLKSGAGWIALDYSKRV